MIRPHRKKNMTSNFSAGIARREEKQSEAVLPEKQKPRCKKPRPKPWRILERYVGVEPFWISCGRNLWHVASRYERERDAKEALKSLNKKGNQWRPGDWEWRIEKCFNA